MGALFALLFSAILSIPLTFFVSIAIILFFVPFAYAMYSHKRSKNIMK
jgi:uncharacterized membrane protein